MDLLDEVTSNANGIVNTALGLVHNLQYELQLGLKFQIRKVGEEKYGLQS